MDAETTVAFILLCVQYVQRKGTMGKDVIRVGVVGAGTVGSGTIEVLLKRVADLERRSGVRVELAAVAELDRAKAIAAGAPEALIVDDFHKVTENPDIDIVVELIGGKGIAAEVVRTALKAGKAVVTANKALLSEKGADLFALARQNNVPLAFEAAVGGGIPCIIGIREGLSCNHFHSLLGILNGTCNFILSGMIQQGLAYADCLKEAQRLGFAEADPTTDVEGFDTGHKLTLLSALAFDTPVDFSKLHIEGISGIDISDIKFAGSLGYAIKLLAVARPMDNKLYLSVHPALLPVSHPLASIHGSLNGVLLDGDIVQESMLVGRGAGKLPTASAVVADIVQVARILKYAPQMPYWTPTEKPIYELGVMSDYQTRYYLRFMVQDEAGVFAELAAALGKRKVSIASVNQQEQKANPSDPVAVVVITHKAREGDVQAALEEIAGKPFTKAAPVLLRIEE